MITKMQQGDKTPQLYTHYGKQYEFGNLQREADQGLGEYLGSLKRGQKDANQFRKAYSDLMSGIGDGSITFSNGRFVDSKGRYTNYKDEDRDYYGLMANYIYSKMGRGQEYTPPEDTSKIKWGDGAGSQLFARKMFNSNTINVPYFMDLDPYDEKTGKRGTQNRARAVADLIQNDLVNNYDSGFRDFTPEQKSSYLNYAQQALKAIQDGTIDSGDYLALYRVMPGIAWEDMFSTQEKLQAQQSTSETRDQQSQQRSDQTTNFEDYLNQKLPRRENSSSDLSLNDDSVNYGDWTRGQILSSIKAMDDTTLRDYLYSAINNPDGNFRYDQRFSNANRVSIPSRWLAVAILGRMKSQGKLIQDSSNPDIWYIPDLLDTKTNSGYYYNAKDNTLHKRSYQDIPYWKDFLYKKWSGQDTSPYFTVAKKNGGILKAQTGVKFSDNANWYSGVFTPLLSHILQGLKSDSNYYAWLNDMQDRHNEIYKAAGNDWQNTAYKNDIVGNYQNLYKSGYNNEWGDNTAGYNSLGIQNAQNQGMFDVSGRKRTSGDWNGNGNNWNTDNLYSAITDYRRLLGREGDYTPEQLKYVTTQFNNAGYDLVKDANNYYKLVPLELTQKPVIDEAGKQDKKVGSDLFPRSGTQGNKKSGNLGYFLSGITPDLAGLNRLFLSLNTNNRVARTLNRTLRPVLRDTYERYSPVTGAFSEMQFRNRQAADLRRQAARPFTSDASLQLAGQLDANRQARELEHQGFLADDQEIRRTKAEALTRQEDNMARRSEVSNFNRASINQTNREKSQLEATRLKSNWQSIDNFLQGVESRLRYNTENRKNLSQQVALSEVSDEYQRSLDFLNQKFKEKYPNATASDMLNNSQYIDAVKKLRRRLQYENNNVLMNQYRIGQYGTPLSYTEILNNITFSKKGGQLHPSSMYLIDKVIRNESNS